LKAQRMSSRPGDEASINSRPCCFAIDITSRNNPIVVFTCFTPWGGSYCAARVRHGVWSVCIRDGSETVGPFSIRVILHQNNLQSCAHEQTEGNSLVSHGHAGCPVSASIKSTIHGQACERCASVFQRDIPGK